MLAKEHDQILQLSDEHFVTKGSHNLVYQHPNNPEYLVKILGIVKVLGLARDVSKIQGLNHRFQNSSWIGESKLMRMVNRFRISKAHVREFIEIIRLRLYDEFQVIPPPFMQKVAGFVDTNLGFGIVVKTERDEQGNFAPTLADLLAQNRVDEKVKSNLENLYQNLLNYDLIVSDLRADNLVYSYDKNIGHHFVLIDGIGDKNIIPVLRLSWYLRKKAKLRYIGKLKRRVERTVAKNLEKC